MVKPVAGNLARVRNYNERLMAAMADSKVSVTALSKHLKISYQAVKKVCDGKSSAFNSENNSKAAAYLGVSADWLATGRGARNPSTARAAADEQPERRTDLSNQGYHLGSLLDWIKDPQRKAAALHDATQAVRIHWRPSDGFGDDPAPIAVGQPALPTDTQDRPAPSEKLP